MSDSIVWLKTKLCVLTLQAIFLFQKFFWAGTTKNTICNQDNVIYSNFFWMVHNWLKEHKDFSDYYLKLPNAILQNGFYFYVMGVFVWSGSHIEAGWANFYFHALRNLLIRWVTFDHPLENLEPGSAPLQPGGQDPDAKSNDYYYSGHTGTAVLALCITIQFERKGFQWCGFIFLVFTGINMSIHHGHYILDIYIGAFVAFLAYILNAKTKFFWNYFFCKVYCIFISQLFCCCLKTATITDPIEKVVEEYKISHPRLQVDEWCYNVVDDGIKDSGEEIKDMDRIEIKDLEKENF